MGRLLSVRSEALALGKHERMIWMSSTLCVIALWGLTL